jgi:hypothetical protein
MELLDFMGFFYTKKGITVFLLLGGGGKRE